MRVFLLSVFAAAALAGVIGVTLTTLNPSVANVNSSAVSVRLDEQEAVNRIGRELVPEQTTPPRS